MNTPALLFPTVSLLLLAYTNRFLAIANLVRALHAQYKAEPTAAIIMQIKSLRRRLLLIRYMQAFGVSSLLLAIVCMFSLYTGYIRTAHFIFGVSLLLLMLSLCFSVAEITVSINALKVILRDIDEREMQREAQESRQVPIA